MNWTRYVNADRATWPPDVRVVLIATPTGSGWTFDVLDVRITGHDALLVDDDGYAMPMAEDEWWALPTPPK